MLKITLVGLALVSSVCMGASPNIYNCDTKDAVGTRGKLKVELATKEISLFSAGASQSIFNSTTLCGWSPKAGTNGVSCPFTTNSADKFLSVDLGCYRGTDPTANAITSGSLQIQNGVGSFICYVHSQLEFNLSLNNCREE